MYSDDIKKLVLEKISQGMSDTEAMKFFKIGRTTICRWKKEGIKQRVKKSYVKKIKPEELIKYIEDNPDAYLKEIAQEFNVSSVAVHKRLKSLGITRKKRQQSTKSKTNKK